MPTKLFYSTIACKPTITKYFLQGDILRLFVADKLHIAKTNLHKYITNYSMKYKIP